MLQSMREGTHSHIIKFVLFSFLLLAVFGLVLMDVGGFFRRGGFQPTTIATIGGEAISAAPFDRQVRRILSRQGMTPAMAMQFGYIDQILNSEIRQRLLARAAADFGIRIPEAAIAAQLRKLIEPMITDGSTPQQALDRVLTGQGMSEKEFVRALSGEMTATILRSPLQAGSSIVPDEIARATYAYDNEKRGLKGFLLRHDKMSGIPDPTEEEIAAKYENSKDFYAIPERRDLSVAVLSAEALKEKIEIPDEDIRREYEQNADLYARPETRLIEQALVKDETQAKSILERTAKGKSLKDSVRDVTKKTDAWQAEQSFEQDGLIKEIAEAAFAAKEGETIGPIQTPLGWHVLAVKKIVPPHDQSLDEVKDKIRADLLQQRTMDRMYEAATAIDDRLAGGGTLEDAASEMNMTVSKIPSMDRNGLDKDGKSPLDEAFKSDSAAILETGFSLGQGESAPVIELSDGRYALIRADAVQPESFKPLDEVRDEIKKSWLEEARAAAAATKAQEALKALREGSSLQDVAKGYDAKIVDVKPFTRGGEPEKPLNGPSSQVFFEIGEGEYAKATVDEGQFVGRVESAVLPDASALTGDQMKAARDKTAAAQENEAGEAFITWLENRYGVSINHQLLQRLYGAGSEDM